MFYDELLRLVLGSIQTVCVVLLARFTHFVSLFCLDLVANPLLASPS